MAAGGELHNAAGQRVLAAEIIEQPAGNAASTNGFLQLGKIVHC
jgi:hypothetical protein